jgi:hypothetical protein
MASKAVSWLGRYIDLAVTAIEIFTGKDGEKVAQDLVRYAITAVICLAVASVIVISVPNTEFAPTIFGTIYASAFIKGSWQTIDHTLQKGGDAVIELFYEEAA